MDHGNQMRELQQAADETNRIITDQESGGRCIFTVADFFKTKNMLSKLLCGIILKERITLSQVENCLRMAIIKAGRKLNELSQDKGNLIKAISGESVSFNKVVQLLVTTLGYDMDITITLTKDGVARKYTYSELAVEMKQRFKKERGA
jgi:hypothetical protein